MPIITFLLVDVTETVVWDSSNFLAPLRIISSLQWHMGTIW